MSAEGSTKAILAALLANAGIAVAKFVGYLITGSSSMLAESVHSVADTSNQALLLLGQRQSRKQADPLHQFGYGRSRYFYSFVVALVLFTLGSVFALYEGYHKISHPQELTSPVVAIVILVLAICLEGFSFRTAVVESRPLKRSGSWWRFIRTSRNPDDRTKIGDDICDWSAHDWTSRRHVFQRFGRVNELGSFIERKRHEADIESFAIVRKVGV